MTVRAAELGRSGGLKEGPPVVVEGCSVQLASQFDWQTGESERRNIIGKAKGFIFMPPDVVIKPTDHVELPEGYNPRCVTVAGVSLLHGRDGAVDHLEVEFN